MDNKIERNYTIVLNSTNAVNRTYIPTSGFNANSASFNIQWDNIIPKELRNSRFALNFSFCASRSNAVAQPLIILSNDLCIEDYDQGMQSGILGMTNFRFYSTTQQVNVAGIKSNVGVTCGYPTNNLVTIRFQQINTGSAPTYNLVNWVLSLSFTPID